MRRVAFAIDDGAGDVKRKRKLEKLPICCEKRRKVFINDYMCDKGLNWDQSRVFHRSIFAPLKVDIPEDQIVPLIDTYTRFKTDDDHKESTDALAVIVPGPPANIVYNRCAEEVFRGLKKHRFQPLKLGRI